MNANHTACNHIDTAAANSLCESFRRPISAPVRTAPAPVSAPVPTSREIKALTNKAIRAHRTYRTAKAANRNPIQSSREVQALAKYTAAKETLGAACRQAGIVTPQTWNL